MFRRFRRGDARMIPRPIGDEKWPAMKGIRGRYVQTGRLDGERKREARQYNCRANVSLTR